MPKTVTILGSTGSIGKSTLDVVRRAPDQFEVLGLCAHSNVELLDSQIREFRPSCVAVYDEEAGRRLPSYDPQPTLFLGPSGIEELAAQKTGILLAAMVGAVGLEAILTAIEAGNDVAIANKEPLVVAGSLIMKKAQAAGVNILPVDSEHNAISQCLHGHSLEDVLRVYLTASGGPFYGTRREELHEVTPEQATRHPTWAMGAKISVDSATLMNKGLEVIEAMHLFNLPLDLIEVVIHPQSIVHGLVEFTDGSILAHLAVTDMRVPIQFALSWPERVKSPVSRLDLTNMKNITFAAPDFSEFPCLELALEAAKLGGSAPATLNAANEVAVEEFCAGRIPFLTIPEIIDKIMQSSQVHDINTLKDVLAADEAARIRARAAIVDIGVPQA